MLVFYLLEDGLIDTVGITLGAVCSRKMSAIEAFGG